MCRPRRLAGSIRCLNPRRRCSTNPPPRCRHPRRPSPRNPESRASATIESDPPRSRTTPTLPGAINPPGGVPANPGSGPVADPFALPPDRMGIGKQRVQLSVEVQASPIINLGKESTVRLVVKNESNVDASGVSLVYQLP